MDATIKFVMNRDDAAGFCLDTTYTQNHYQTVSLKDQSMLTTCTDHVNKYKCVLQTSMHLVMETKTTALSAQKVLGVVKPPNLK